MAAVLANKRQSARTSSNNVVTGAISGAICGGFGAFISGGSSIIAGAAGGAVAGALCGSNDLLAQSPSLEIREDK